MRKIVIILLLLFLLVNSSTISQGVTIQSDPQYVVMNLADIILLDWGVSESEWENKVKPDIVAKVREIKESMPRGNDDRMLAWSTLQEYMNHPMDEPSTDSYYALK